jgi:hypothetical protein
MACPGSHPALPRGRTECVPPRKPPSASSPGLPRKAISPPPRPPRRGGLRTPATTELASPEHVAIWPPGIRLPPMIMLYPGSHPALPRGRTECVPPRKPAPALSPGSPRKAILPWMALPLEGPAPYARKGGMTPTRAHLLLAIGLFAHPPAIMTCPGSHPASPRGRTECVPPRKPPFASSRAFPVRPFHLRLALRGGAGSVRPQKKLPFHRGIAPLGHQAFVCPR